MSDTNKENGLDLVGKVIAVTAVGVVSACIMILALIGTIHLVRSWL